MKPLAIAEAAELLGLSVHTLRYYERVGLLDAVARKGGQRRYEQADLDWLRFIQRLRATGMGMRQIEAYAQLRREGDSTTFERMRLLQTHLGALEERERELAMHRRALAQKIQAYERMLADAGPGAEPHAKTRTARKRRRPGGWRNEHEQ